MGDNNNPADKAKQDAMYEDREPKKIIRIITVTAYMISVSFVGLTLSTYYVFLWHPPNPRLMHAQARETHSERFIGDNNVNGDEPIASRLTGNIGKNGYYWHDNARRKFTDGQLAPFKDKLAEDEENAKTRRQIVERANLLLRTRFENEEGAASSTTGITLPLQTENITENASTELSLISTINKNTTDTTNSSSFYPSEQQSSSTTTYNEKTITTGTESTTDYYDTSTTRLMKNNSGKKRHQTPFALKHLVEPIKFNNLRKKKTLGNNGDVGLTTTTFTTMVTLDSREASPNGISSPTPTTEPPHDDNNPSYPLKSLYKTLTTPPSRKVNYDLDYDEQILNASTERQQRANNNNDDYQQQDD